MGNYTAFKDGYARETTFGSNVANLDGAGDTTYLLGAVSQKSIHPSPTYTTISGGVGYNVKEPADAMLWKSQADLRGMYGLVVQNGILLELAMGTSSTAGSDPYTHTIGPYTDGSLLPSITIHHEKEGTATDEEFQFRGAKIDSLMLSHDMTASGPNVLMAKIEWIAANAADPGFALTNDPALPATANTDPYTSLERKWDTGGTPVNLDGLAKVEVSIANGLTPLHAHSYDTGTYTGQWAYAFAEAAQKQYMVKMSMHLNTIERALWDELITNSNTKSMTLKWIRGTNDYILLTFSDCQVIEHSITTPKDKGETNLEDILIVPRALAVEVKDSIGGTLYGE